MTAHFETLRHEDEKKAMAFAITGMHFDHYMESPFLQRLYARYFWYLESGKATQNIAMYDEDQLLGILLASMKDEKPIGSHGWRHFYVSAIDFIQEHFFKGADSYNDANTEMLAAYAKMHQLDGEIVFLAADPEAKVKGIGTALLKELERRETGKRIYLFTDSQCTWQFYEHRGFEKAGEKDIKMDLSGNDVGLTCLLYSKVCAG